MSSTYLNSIFALPTLVVTLASLGLRAGAVVQSRSSNQELYHDKEPQQKFAKHPPKPGLKHFIFCSF
jgi:hypothetical protein